MVRLNYMLNKLLNFIDSDKASQILYRNLLIFDRYQMLVMNPGFYALPHQVLILYKSNN